MNAQTQANVFSELGLVKFIDDSSVPMVWLNFQKFSFVLFCIVAFWYSMVLLLFNSDGFYFLKYLLKLYHPLTVGPFLFTVEFPTYVRPNVLAQPIGTS